jgi:gas vesicle protein
MTPEQTYQLTQMIIGGIIGAITALVATYGIQARSRAKVEEAKIDIERDNDTTENYVTKRITDNYIEKLTENATLYQRVSKAETKNAEDEAIIRELRKMVEDKNVQIETQSKFLRESAGEIRALQDLNNLQQAKIQELEVKAASKLDDGYKG